MRTFVHKAMSRVLFVVGTCAVVGLMVSPAAGTRNPAKRARKLMVPMVQGVEPCLATNTKAPGILQTPACDPVVPSDAGCVFGLKGMGRVIAIEKHGDIAIHAKLTGIDPACSNATLCLVVTMRASQDNCASTGDCTTHTQLNFPLWLTCCAVTESGRCTAKTSVNQGLPGLLVPGNRTEFVIGEVGFVRTGSSGAAFRGGLMLP